MLDKELPISYFEKYADGCKAQIFIFTSNNYNYKLVEEYTDIQPNCGRTVYITATKP